MASKRLELQIHGPTSNFTFDVEGLLTSRWEPVYKTSSDPPQIVEMRDVWEFRGCRIRSADGTTEALWGSVNAFRARLVDRVNFPEYARLVRDPDGANATILELGPDGGYERFRVESVEGGPDPQVADASWRTTATFDLRLSAVQVLADPDEEDGGGGTGLVGFEQTVDVSYDQSGLRTLRWTTRLTTPEGTDVRTKAALYARIPDASLGGDHAWQTNGPDGISYSYLDADEESDRVPTVADVVSEIKQYNLSTGVTAPGFAPGHFAYSQTTTTTKDETTTETVAEAIGPNSYTWVIGKAPSVFNESEIKGSDSERHARGVWRNVVSTKVKALIDQQIDVKITGGHKAQRWTPIANGLPPILSEGGFTPVRCEVSFTGELRGGTGVSGEIKVPPKLAEPWRLDGNESEEGLPLLVELGADSAQNRWRREARYVYYSATVPTTSPLAALREGGVVSVLYPEMFSA